jgi:hypothetical protein
MRRRRATGGPAEATFAALVGLELRPRRLRDAATLWGALRAAEGAAARDAVWAHRELLPTAADLDDPLAYAARTREADSIDTESPEFDAALAALLDQANASTSSGADSADDASDGSSDGSRSSDDSSDGSRSSDDSSDDAPGT